MSTPHALRPLALDVFAVFFSPPNEPSHASLITLVGAILVALVAFGSTDDQDWYLVISLSLSLLYLP